MWRRSGRRHMVGIGPFRGQHISHRYTIPLLLLPALLLLLPTLLLLLPVPLLLLPALCYSCSCYCLHHAAPIAATAAAAHTMPLLLLLPMPCHCCWCWCCPHHTTASTGAAYATCATLLLLLPVLCCCCCCHHCGPLWSIIVVCHCGQSLL